MENSSPGWGTQPSNQVHREVPRNRAPRTVRTLARFVQRIRDALQAQRPVDPGAVEGSGRDSLQPNGENHPNHPDVDWNSSLLYMGHMGWVMGLAITAASWNRAMDALDKNPHGTW